VKIFAQNAKNLIQFNENKFDCLVCKNKHEITKEGLPINKSKKALLSSKPAEVLMEKAYELFGNLMNNIKNNKLNTIKHIIEKSNNFVKNHCIDLRNEVQLSTEEVIQQIKDISAKLIKEINDYERYKIFLWQGKSSK